MKVSYCSKLRMPVLALQGTTPETIKKRALLEAEGVNFEGAVLANPGASWTPVSSSGYPGSCVVPLGGLPHFGGPATIVSRLQVFLEFTPDFQGVLLRGVSHCTGQAMSVEALRHAASLPA